MKAWLTARRTAFVTLAAAGFLLPALTTRAQAVDRSAPPIAEASTGGFTVRRLPGPVAVDDRIWLDIQPLWPGDSAVTGNGEYSVSLEQTSDEGDVQRALPMLARPGEAPVGLTREVVAYAFITADARWVFVEPIDVIDVVAWRRFSLSQEFGVAPYASPEAISADGRRLLFSRRDCAFDCPTVEREYFEVEIPSE